MVYIPITIQPILEWQFTSQKIWLAIENLSKICWFLYSFSGFIKIFVSRDRWQTQGFQLLARSFFLLRTEAVESLFTSSLRIGHTHFVDVNSGLRIQNSIASCLSLKVKRCSLLSALCAPIFEQESSCHQFFHQLTGRDILIFNVVLKTLIFHRILRYTRKYEIHPVFGLHFLIYSLLENAVFNGWHFKTLPRCTCSSCITSNCSSRVAILLRIISSFECF